MQLGLYQHFKGAFYHVLGVSRHSETLETFVVYRALYGDYELWIRPIENFQAEIEIDGKKMPRFKFITTLFEEAPSIDRPIAN
jgi:hypothetical protein